MPDIQKIVCKNNYQWRHERAKSIGASAVGTILGLSPFMSPQQLAELMQAELLGKFDYSQTFAMMRGHAYEGGVAQLFEWFSGYKVIQASSAEYIVRRSDIPFLHASPDRIYWLTADGPQHGKLAETNKGVLECKTTRRSVKPDSIPLPWILQLQVQMGITGYRSGHLAWDVLSKTEGFGYASFAFNEQLFSAIVDICREFWNRSIIGHITPHGRFYLAERHPILLSDSWKQPQQGGDCQRTPLPMLHCASTLCPPLPTWECTVDDSDDDQEQKKPTTDNISFFEKLWQRVTSKE